MPTRKRIKKFQKETLKPMGGTGLHDSLRRQRPVTKTQPRNPAGTKRAVEDLKKWSPTKKRKKK